MPDGTGVSEDEALPEAFDGARELPAVLRELPPARR
jgi:hypothetical protein